MTELTEEPPVQLSQPDWRETQRVLATEVPGLEIWAFGSRARRTAKPYSDLDLAVIRATPLSLEQLAALNHAFEASDMTIRVDVVDWAATSDAFRQVIAREKVVLVPTSTKS